MGAVKAELTAGQQILVRQLMQTKSAKYFLTEVDVENRKVSSRGIQEMSQSWAMLRYDTTGQTYVRTLTSWFSCSRPV